MSEPATVGRLLQMAREAWPRLPEQFFDSLGRRLAASRDAQAEAAMSALVSRGGLSPSIRDVEAELAARAGPPAAPDAAPPRPAAAAIAADRTVAECPCCGDMGWASDILRHLVKESGWTCARAAAWAGSLPLRPDGHEPTGDESSVGRSFRAALKGRLGEP